MAQHELKTDPDVFQLSWDGEKPWEIRKDDRGYKPGDILILRETEYSGDEMRNGFELEYTGRQVTRKVINVVRGYARTGWVVMTVAPV